MEMAGGHFLIRVNYDLLSSSTPPYFSQSAKPSFQPDVPKTEKGLALSTSDWHKKNTKRSSTIRGLLQLNKWKLHHPGAQAKHLGGSLAHHSFPPLTPSILYANRLSSAFTIHPTPSHSSPPLWCKAPLSLDATIAVGCYSLVPSFLFAPL